jgi:hypothetical protein
MRFDNALHGNGSNCSVRRIAAGLQNFNRSARCQGMRGCGYGVPRENRRPAWCLKITLH